MPREYNKYRRPAIHCYVSPEAHGTLHDTAAKHGVTLSGLVEALAGHLDRAVTKAVVTEARAVDNRRRRR